MDKLPALQFYPGDWMKDPAVRSLSAAARGLWIDMLCLMHESEKRGFLQLTTSKSIEVVHLSRMTGISPKETRKLLKELEEAGVFSRDENGVIYSRRMVKDELFRLSRVENGKLGGRPKQSKKEPTLKPTPEPTGNLNISPSSSSSLNTLNTLSKSDDSDQQKSTPNFKEIRKEKPEKEIFDHWNSKDFYKHRVLTDKCAGKIKSALKEFTVDEIKEAIDNYIIVMAGKEYFFNYRWSLEDFASRGVKSFVQAAKPLYNFLIEKTKQQSPQLDLPMTNVTP